jgi:hypothetical protein
MPAGFVFLAPWLLGFLAALPVIWWLLRLLPPSPRKVTFPALALLRDLAMPEKMPVRTPWWLLLLRLSIAGLIVVAFARPAIDLQPAVTGNGNVLITVDNDWASARAWDARQDMLHSVIAQAEREGRSVILLPTTPPANGEAIQSVGPMAAKAAYAIADNIKPQAWPADWHAAREALAKIPSDEIGYAIWLNSGLGGGDAHAFFDALKVHSGLNGVRVFSDAASTPIYLLAPPVDVTTDDSFSVIRAATDSDAVITVSVRGKNGQGLAQAPVSFMPGSPRTPVKLDLPLDVHNSAARIEIEGQHTAGAVALLDENWQHRPVGIIGDEGEAKEHSLLSGVFYIERALKPFADIHVGTLDALLAQSMAVIVATDATAIESRDAETLAAWIKKGGVFVRFAGDRLANTNADQAEADLLPVALRTGDRALGGTMSWATPQTLHDFPASSPFHGLAIPADVTINRQVLAEPSAELEKRTWATLADGTPLVTAKNSGRGLSILFHVPARSEWSNLPLSGLFVDMLRRIVELSAGVPSTGGFTTLPPAFMLDAYGEQQPASEIAEPIDSSDFSTLKPGPHHPPGIYGTAGAGRAFNLGQALGQPEALRDIASENYSMQANGNEWRPYLLAAAFILWLFDFALSLFQRGLFGRMVRSRPATPKDVTKIAAAVMLFILLTHPAHADDKQSIELTSKTYLAYIQTGDREIDQISEAGLTGLARVLERRTSLNEVGVAAVSPEGDELAFFPLIYWPLTATAVPVSPAAAAHVNDYLHHGGMILFDGAAGGSPLSTGDMQRILAGIDIPPLAHIPENHVLHRTFYLLDEFPGRFAGDDLWLEPEELALDDGVSSVIAGNGGWAGAWAIDDSGKPMFACVPGGETQREQALRFGVNLAMYALTGNYKSDQMHVQALLEREGK